MLPRWLFYLLLHLYPGRLRSTHGEEMWHAFQKKELEARAAGRGAVVRLWLRELAAALRVLAGRIRSGLISVAPRLSELRLAPRVLRREPGFGATVVTVMTLALVAATTVLTIVRAVLVTPLPFEDPGQLITIWSRTAGNPRSSVAGGDFTDLRRSDDLFTSVAAWQGIGRSLVDDEVVDHLRVSVVSPNYLSTLGVAPALGRDFDPGEQREVILRHSLWRTRFGGDSALVGATIRLGSGDYTVVGILPEGVNPNLTEIDGSRAESEALIPLSNDVSYESRSISYLRIVARVRDDVSASELDAGLARLTEHMRQFNVDRGAGGWELYRLGVLEEIVAPVRPYMILLTGAVVLVLAIAVVNVGSLFLVRALRVRGEAAVRSALGAGRTRILVHSLLESALLVVLGGALSIAISYFTLEVIRSAASPIVPRLGEMRLDAGVLIIGIAVTLVAALGASLLPALQVARTDPVLALSDQRSSGSTGQRRLISGLVVAQVALSMVLLTGSGLLLRTLAEVLRVDPGYDIERLATFQLWPLGFESEAEAMARMDAVFTAVESVPGVSSFDFTNRFPLAGGSFGGPYAGRQGDTDAGDTREGEFRWVTPGYMETMGARLLAGRTFTAADGPEVVVVDDVLAETVWPNQDPVGRSLWTGSLGRDDGWSTVVGVVRHMRSRDLTRDGSATVYFPNQFRGLGQILWGAVRTEGVDPAAILERIPPAIRSTMPDASIDRLTTGRALASDHLAPRVLALRVLGVFATISVVLTAAGVAGVAALSVRHRQRELAIRTALGQTPRRTMTGILGSSLSLTALGIGVGLTGAIALGGLIRSLLFGVGPLDPLVLTGGVLVISTVSFLASLGPALRAATVDPVSVLRTV